MLIHSPAWDVALAPTGKRDTLHALVLSSNVVEAMQVASQVLETPLLAVDQIHVILKQSDVILDIDRFNLVAASHSADLQARLNDAVDGWNELIAVNQRLQAELNATSLNLVAANRAVGDMDMQLRQCRETLANQRDLHATLRSDYDSLMVARAALEQEVAGLRHDAELHTGIVNDLQARLYAATH